MPGTPGCSGRCCGWGTPVCGGVRRRWQRNRPATHNARFTGFSDQGPRLVPLTLAVFLQLQRYWQSGPVAGTVKE